MRTSRLSLLVSSCLLAVAVTAVTVALFVWRDNRELGRQVEVLLRDSERSRSEAVRLEGERAGIVAQLERLQALQTELATLRSSLASNPPVQPVAARAFRVPTYVGRQFLGHSWIVPGQAATNVETGQIGYAPVVVLDESVRGNVAASKTNVVEREVARSTTVNYHYSYPNYAWWPMVWTPVTTGGKPHAPSSPPRFPQPVKRMPQGQGLFVTATPNPSTVRSFRSPLPQSP